MKLILSVAVAGATPEETVMLDIIKTRHLTAAQRARRRGLWKTSMNLGKTRASMPALVREVRE